MKTIIVFVLLIQLLQIKSDLPIHCLKSQIEGKWEFELEEKIENMNPLDNHCGHQMPDNEKTSYLAKKDTFHPVQSLLLHLNPDGTVTSTTSNTSPRFKAQSNEINQKLHQEREKTTNQQQQQQNKKEYIEMQRMQKIQQQVGRYSQQDQDGFQALLNRLDYQPRFYDNLWTMIYDEGFELSYQGQRMFMYNTYYPDKKNNDQMVSDCTTTLVGWYHDLYTNQYTCVRGRQLSSHNNNNNNRFAQTSSQTEESQQKPLYLPNDFKDHQRMADKLNQLNLGWTAGVSEDFKDLSIDDLHSLAGRKGSLKDFQQYSFKSSNGYLPMQKENLSDLPTQFSWAAAFGKVKNQGKCGSCYIFAFLEMLHARINIMYGDQVELSYQHALDCMYYNQGCEGGFPTLVARFGNEVGFVPETCKPYQGIKGQCNQMCNVQNIDYIYKVGEYGYVNTVYGHITQRQIMQEIIKNGPIVLSLDVDYPFMIYKSGIYSKAPANWLAKGEARPQWTKLAHSVVCYGWGEDSSGRKYWLIRNSWGHKWGENGQMKIERGNDVLGVESSPEYAIPIKIHLQSSPAHKNIYQYFNTK